jgi:hypothetical protein
LILQEPNEEVEEIKKQVRQAMKILEEGKQVAAFNLLKRIVEKLARLPQTGEI